MEAKTAEAPAAAEAASRLKQCVEACEDYAEKVFAALHGNNS